MNGALLHAPLAGNFYAVFPHNLLVALFGAVFALRGAGAGHRRARFWRDVSPPGARRPPARARPRPPRDALRAEVPRRRPRRGLQRGRRPLHAVAPALPPPDVLRLPAVLRGHLRRHALPLPASAGSAPYALTSLPVLLGTVGRHRPADRPGRPAVAEPAPPSAARRRGAAADGPRLHRAAVPHQPHRPGAAGLARHRRDGAAAGACTWAS